MTWVSKNKPSVVFTVDENGAVPNPGTATGLFLRDDGTWSSATSYQMVVGGCLEAPLTDLGIELIAQAATLTTFRARRGTAGSSGTTTIQLELNGSPIVGATLSWLSTDADNTLKTVAISQAVSVDDRLSFRLTAAEVAAEDIYARAA